MIVGARPRFRQIIIEVWKPLTILFVWDVAVDVAWSLSWERMSFRISMVRSVDSITVQA